MEETKKMERLSDFLKLISSLKLTARKGWITYDVPGTKETIGSHSFGTVFIAWILSKKKSLDTEKVIKLAIVHDILEAITGDITIHDKEFEKKETIEKEALIELNKKLPDELKNEINDLLQELKEGKTEESKVCLQADKLDTAFQTYLYEKKKYGKDIEESTLTRFFDWTDSFLKDEFAKEFLNYIRSLRGK